MLATDTWKSIGNGDVVAEPLIRDYWNKRNSIKMRDFAKLSHCIIKFIEQEELAVGVGLGGNNSSVRYLEHDAEIDRIPNATDFEAFESCYESYSKDFQQILGQEFFNLKRSTREFKRHLNQL